ncbi:MAG: MBL fold metallo-hydrolase [Pirellulaceae bacterium]|nr:MBL fold metallo-hydrolase [Pirellulaceae bacterium]
MQAIYHNYLSTNALNWYFKADRMRACGRRVLGQDAEIELMPYCEYHKTPDWIYENSTSRLIMSETGAGFLLDCGSARVIEAINELIQQQAVDKVEGIFVTHFHDDHTDAVAEAVKAFKCPAYATEEYSDVLEQPEAFHLPAMTEKPIENIKLMKDGAKMKWHEYTFTFHFFPGQTFYHGAMLVEKEGEKPIFFIGDAFAPSGFDDYCVLNRNLLHDDEGYLLCLQKIRDAGDCWLINEHIRHVFQFNTEELDYLTKRYRERRTLIRETVAWDDANYAVDEQWAVLYPRSETISSTEGKRIELRLTNHSAKARNYLVRFNLPENIVSSDNLSPQLNLQPGSVGKVSIRIKATTRWKGPAWRIMTADVETEEIHVREWCDAYLTCQEASE